ncbi:MAG: hypothetical protein GY859_29330, partial [Desulfobacterales bacterium]|nr:hypothetical protein [Desulfobacterales bacterium]
LAFSCLPNMPAHHLSANFDIQGEYFITYPGVAQFYLALQEAVARLREGSLDLALVGGVADQNNFLVENHWSKRRPGATPRAADAAGFITLEREESARERGKAALARLVSVEDVRRPKISKGRRSSDAAPGEHEPDIELGPGDLPLQLSAFIQNRGGDLFVHTHETKDRLFRSRWKI